MHLLRVIVACKALLLRLKKTFRRKLQAAVSQSRRRFKDPGTEFTCSTSTKVQILTPKALPDGDFDLDLTYICDRLIAMSLPCVGGAFYRNDMRDVARFFANFHYGSFTGASQADTSCGQISGTEVLQNLKLVVLKYYKP